MSFVSILLYHIYFFPKALFTFLMYILLWDLHISVFP